MTNSKGGNSRSGSSRRARKPAGLAPDLRAHSRAVTRVPEPSSQGDGARTVPDGPQRRAMIAEAAYYRAEKRGSEESDPVRDWLEAETEIEQRLGEHAND